MNSEETIDEAWKFRAILGLDTAGPKDLFRSGFYEGMNHRVMLYNAKTLGYGAVFFVCGFLACIVVTSLI